MGGGGGGGGGSSSSASSSLSGITMKCSPPGGSVRGAENVSESGMCTLELLDMGDE